MSNRPTRPGIGHLTCTILAGLVAILSIIAAVSLTVIDTHDRAFPNTIVTSVDSVAVGAVVVSVVLVASWHAQTRVLSAVADLRADLKADTGQIPRIREEIRTPDVIVVREPERRYEQVDRAVLQKLLDSAEEAKANTADREQYWNIYSDVLTDLAGIGATEGETPETQ